MPSRRFFVLSGLGAAGALVVGYAVWPSDRLARLDRLDAKAGGQFLANWIRVEPDDTVTVVIPHCDMGTGIYTALAQMAAEELDADWNKVRVEAAPADPLFANGPLIESFLFGAQGMTRDDLPPYLRGTVDNTFRTLAAAMDIQVTGGSSAIRATGQYGMRIAGAAAREMLIKAAAARWKVSTLDCATRGNRVWHPETRASLGYGELAAEAAAYAPSSNPSFKPKRDYTLVGKPIGRIDIPAKVDGSAKYGIDTIVPGVAYAAIRICPTFGGKLKSVDETPLRGRRGILKLVKLDDAVVVVADRFWRAKNAVAAIDPVFDNGDNAHVTSQTIRAQRVAALNGKLSRNLKIGYGGDAIYEPGRKTFEAVYEVPYLAHATMEPMNTTALYKNGKLEVWAGTQDGLGARAFCAKAAGLSLGDVTFHLLPMGGGFGRRLPNQFNYLTYAVKTAMAVSGTPVKLIFTREDDMQHDFYRPNVVSRMAASLDTLGAPLAWQHDFTVDKQSDPAERLQDVGVAAHIPYDIPNQEYRYVEMAMPVPIGAWRSVEYSWHGFFVESFIDELAHMANADPLAYRLSLLTAKPRHRAVLAKAASAARWGSPLQPGQGRGIAVTEAFGTVVAQVAEVEVDGRGALKVHRMICAADCGHAVNPDGFRAQMEGGTIFGLTATLFGRITIDKGAVVEGNFPDYEMVRLADCPEIEVHIVDSNAPPGGGGEPGVPPVAPAVANAVFAACGFRARSLPINQELLAARGGPAPT